MRWTPRATRLVVIATLTLVATACGGSDAVESEATDVPAVSDDQAPGESDPLFVRTSESERVGETTETPADDEAAAAPTSAEDDSDIPVVAAPGSTTTTVPVPLVPDTGVPGIDSDDPFCQSWSQFAGSFRAIGLVTVIRDPDAGRRLEVIASEAVIASIDGMDEHLPDELEAERDLLLSGLAGPFGRRALRANEALSAAGIGGDDFDVLTDAWLTTLADVGVDDPDLDVDVPAGVDAAAVEAAAVAFAAATPPIGQDPSLNTFVETPLTDAYTQANCPDGGTLAGNDDL